MIPIIIPKSNLNSRVNQKIYIITSKAVKELNHHQSQNQQNQQQQHQEQEEQQLHNQNQQQQLRYNKEITRMSRLPFLPNRPPIPYSVKKNQLVPVEKNLNATINPSSSALNTVNILIDKHCPNSSIRSSLNLNSNNYNNYKKADNIIYPQTPIKTNQPLTLAMMAGIQLSTDADPSAADMSGVVQTATSVEELNVPVFIDGLEAATRPPLATSAKELYNCNNSNNSETTNYSKENGNSNSDEGKSYFEDDIFEDLEFDIDDLIVNPTEVLKEQKQQHQQQQEEEQLIISDIPLYNNNINNNNITIPTTTEDNSNEMLNTLDLKSEPTTINEHFDIMECIDMMKKENLDMYDECAKREIKMYSNDDDFLMEQQYRLLPGALEDTQITYIDDNEIELLQNIPEDAVCFENDMQIPDLSDVLTNSQQNPLLGCGMINTPSQSQSQPIQQFSQLLREEPYVPEFNELDAATTSCCISNNNNYHHNIAINNNNNILIDKMRKRSASIKDDVMQAEKRKKLRLNITASALTSAAPLNTPDIVNLISEMRDDEVPPFLEFPQHSPAEVLYDLFNVDDNNSNQQLNDMDVDDMIDESAPATPFSSYSTSHQTSFSGDGNTMTPPNSPAMSVFSNQNDNNSSNNDSSSISPGKKKKRGRPAKEHSDRPNPSLLKQLSESERKRLEDRAKNNEASRLSRQKNKQREQEEIEEENELQDRHDELVDELVKKERIVNKLKQALQRKYLET